MSVDARSRSRSPSSRNASILVFSVLALLVGAGVLVGQGATAVTPRPHSFAVGLRVLQFVDKTRTIRLPDGSVDRRRLTTFVRYPASDAAPGTDRWGAPAARSAGPFPLVVFGHGYALTPASYRQLLRAWTSAGYVVAAPVFPLENARAPGGPNERDLINQPADMRFVISRLLAASSAPTGSLSGMIDPSRIAVAGHSDGGETALAAAFDSRFRDPRIRAAVILSGAEIPEAEFNFPRRGPALLATQGSADTVNLPRDTLAFFDIAPRPKFLLTLLHAEHLPPYTNEQPQLHIVERVTIAFLNHYLKHEPLRPLLAAGAASALATLTADP